MQFVGVGWIGPGFARDPPDRLGVEPADIGGGSRRRASAGPSPPGSGAPPAARRPETHRAWRTSTSSASGEGSVRSRATIADLRPPPTLASSRSSPTMSIASFRQSAMVWLTSGWSGTSRSPTRFSAQAIWSGNTAPTRSSASMRANCGGTLLAAAHAGQGERDSRRPAPARREHRRIEHRLNQDGSRARRMQIAGGVAEFETMRGRQRQHDIVFGRRRLQLEIELAAEAFAQGQAPGAIERLPKGEWMTSCMPPASSKKRSSTIVSCVGRQPSAASDGQQIFGELFGRRPRQGPSHRQAMSTRRSRQPPPCSRAATSPRSRDTENESSSAAAGRLAEPERNGRRHAVRVLDAHEAALDPQDSIGAIAELKDVAGHAFDGEILVDRTDRTGSRARA